MLNSIVDFLPTAVIPQALKSMCTTTAHLYDEDSEPYDERDENYASSDNEEVASYCEVCDREFETAELLDRHTESHKICGVDGCTFSAHPKLVEKHISMQHCTGLYRRMKNLSTPEDIEKWIAERKKKYPTKINIEQRIAEDTAKRKRGEVIEEKNIFDRSKHARKTTRDKTRKVRKRRTRGNAPETEALSTEYYRGLRPFAGTADLRRTGSEETMETMDTERLEHTETETDLTLPDLSGNISDDDEPINSLQLSKSTSGCSAAEPEKSVQSCLLSLVADYGSDSDDDEGPEQVPIKRESSDFPMEDYSHQTPKKSLAELRSESQVNTRDRHSKTTKSRPKQAQRRTPNDKNDKNDKRSPRKIQNGRFGDKKRLMLLQRLLSRSIQHERNIICQCIKYIADNDFFQ